MIDRIFSTLEGDFHYIDWGGTGPLLHVSHATGFCARIYTPLVERLTARLQVVGMDDRGHGRTDVPADPRYLKNWRVFVDDLERFVEYLGHPVVAMGHSRGGVVSLMLAARRPDLVKALILVDPTILPQSWMWWLALGQKLELGKYIPIAAQAARRTNGWPNREAAYKSWLGRGIFRNWQPGFLEGYITDGLTEDGNGGVRLTCDPAWEARCFAVCSHDVWRYIPRIAPPTLVLYGQDSDTFLPAAVHRLRRLSPQTTIYGFEQTTHFVPMERSEETAGAILEFLQTNGVIG